MSFKEARNSIISRLWEYMGCPVVLSNQVEPEADLPYGIYSVLSSYTPDGGMGAYSETDVDPGVEITRREMPTATMSFTFCSENRTGPDGEFIYGEDESEALADKAAGYFLHGGCDDFLQFGLTVVEVGPVGDRTTLVVDEAARRFGFDVKIRYTREDTRIVSSIEKTIIKETKE